jgi:hypothetical protein
MKQQLFFQQLQICYHLHFKKMKLLFVQLIAVCFLVSCGASKNEVVQEKKESENILAYEIIHRNVLAPENQEDTTTIHLVYAFYENPTLPYMKTVNDLIKGYLGTNWISEDSPFEEQMTKKYASAFVQGFETEYLIAKKDWVDMHPWEMDMDLRVDDKTFKNYIQCNFANYSFTGGAHGNSNVQYAVVDKESGKKLDLNGICTNRTELNNRVEKIFRKEYEIPVDQSFEEFGLNFENNAFNVSDNFIFDSSSITFFYNQYEIGPYSAGTFSVSIPMSEVQDIFSLNFGAM